MAGIKKEVEEQKQSLYSSDELTNIDKWYDDIKAYTFETRFISLNTNEAKAITFCYEYYSTFKSCEMETNGNEKGIGLNLYYDDANYKNKYGEYFDWRMALSSNKKYNVHLEHLNILSNKINQIINEMECENGIFVKLNRRSPKDSANESIKMFEMMKKQLSHKCGNNFKTVTNSQIIDSYFYSATKSLCVSNGDEAIELFSRSYRIWKDIQLSMLKENRFLSVIVRKWENNIDPLWEFRLFLRNQKATALTQYNPNIYSPQMYKLKKEIQDLILCKYKKIEPLLSHKLQYFTMDFAVIMRKDKELESIVIEINPGPPVAGTALFIWENSTDRLVLSGQKPFETRINSSFHDIQNLNDLQPILPDSVIYFVELLKGNKMNKTDHPQQDRMNDLNHFCVVL